MKTPFPGKNLRTTTPKLPKSPARRSNDGARGPCPPRVLRPPTEARGREARCFAEGSPDRQAPRLDPGKQGRASRVPRDARPAALSRRRALCVERRGRRGGTARLSPRPGRVPGDVRLLARRAGSRPRSPGEEAVTPLAELLSAIRIVDED